MSKKRYTLYISRPLARRFDLIAQQRNGAKSALVEDALRVALEPQQHTGIEEALTRRLNELNRVVGGLRREMSVATETLAIFVRYFLTVTPPLPQDEQEPARLLGRERYQVLLTEVGRRVAENERLVRSDRDRSRGADRSVRQAAGRCPARGQSHGSQRPRIQRASRGDR